MLENHIYQGFEFSKFLKASVNTLRMALMILWLSNGPPKAPDFKIDTTKVIFTLIISLIIPVWILNVGVGNTFQNFFCGTIWP